MDPIMIASKAHDDELINVWMSPTFKHEPWIYIAPYVISWVSKPFARENLVKQTGHLVAESVPRSKADKV